MLVYRSGPVSWRSRFVRKKKRKEVCSSFNFAVVFNFKLFPVPPNKAKSIADVLVNSQNAAIRSMGVINASRNLLLVPTEELVASAASGR